MITNGGNKKFFLIKHKLQLMNIQYVLFLGLMLEIGLQGSIVSNGFYVHRILKFRRILNEN